VAYATGLDFNQNLTCFWASQVYLDHFQRLPRRPCDCSFRFHAILFSTARTSVDPVRGERQSLPAA
jgi:hypothetical protein